MWAEIVIQDYTGLFPIQPTGSQSFFFNPDGPSEAEGDAYTAKTSLVQCQIRSIWSWWLGKYIHMEKLSIILQPQLMLTRARCTRHIVTFTNACFHPNSYFVTNVTWLLSRDDVMNSGFLIGHQWINISMNSSDIWQIS